MGVETSRIPHLVENRDKDGGQVVSFTLPPPPFQGIFLVLISVRDWVNRIATVRLEGSGKLKKEMNYHIGIGTLALVAWNMAPHSTELSHVHPTSNHCEAALRVTLNTGGTRNSIFFQQADTDICYLLELSPWKLKKYICWLIISSVLCSNINSIVNFIDTIWPMLLRGEMERYALVTHRIGCLLATRWTALTCTTL
jgi:hypothetical protein